MKKVFKFGKIDYNGSGRKNCTVEVEIRLEEEHNSFYDKDYLEFTACGDIWNPRHTDSYSCGQNLDTIKEHIPDNLLFDVIYRMWKKYHLNGLHAGTKEQEQAVNEYFKRENKRYDYTEACDYLKSINLYEVTEADKSYKYGHGWLCQDIPEEDLEIIKGLFKGDTECPA